MVKDLRAKPIIRKLKSELIQSIAQYPENLTLEIFKIGNDSASDYYVENILKKAKKVGIQIELKRYADDVSFEKFQEDIKQANQNPQIHGIMVQKPLPENFNDYEIAELIDPLKDVDGFTPYNLGKIMLGEDALIPCTPAAVLELIDYYNIEVEGKGVVIVGRSNIVGKPLANLLLKKSKIGNATLSICHSRTKNLEKITKNAEILIAAIGKAEFIKKNMIKENSVLIDVGINEIVDNSNKKRYVGDIDFAGCYDNCRAITPVPGGIGSITTYMLLKNVEKAYKIQKKNKII